MRLPHCCTYFDLFETICVRNAYFEPRDTVHLVSRTFSLKQYSLRAVRFFPAFHFSPPRVLYCTDFASVRVANRFGACVGTAAVLPKRPFYSNGRRHRRTKRIDTTWTFNVCVHNVYAYDFARTTTIFAHYPAYCSTRGCSQ